MFKLVFFSLALFIPILTFGQSVTYSPLVTGGGLDTSNIGAYINSLYLLSISVAALLATIKLIIAGAKYMLSDVVTTQGEAKKEIQSSLLGLLLVISAVLILTIINPALITNELNIARVAETNLTLDANQENNNIAGLMNGCGTRSETETSREFTTTFVTTGCTDLEEEAKKFTDTCTSLKGTVSQSSDKTTYTCKVPKDAIITTSSESAQIEFDFSGYNVLFLVAKGFLFLRDVYVDETLSSGSVLVYDSMRQCKDEISEKYQSNYVDSCLENIETLLYSTCAIEGAWTCNTGWCKHNAGEKTTVSGKPACRLPTKRFTATEVENKYKEVTPAETQASGVFGIKEFANACSLLGGTTADIELYIESIRGGLANQRCVIR